jgi:hypothetical protein
VKITAKNVGQPILLKITHFFLLEKNWPKKLGYFRYITAAARK